MAKEYQGFPPPKAGVLLLPFQPDAGAIKAWLENLPIAEPARCSTLMLRALQSLNHHTLSPRQRFEFAELCRPCACYLAAAQERGFLDAEAPLDGDAFSSLSGSAWLHMELLNAYKLVMKEESFRGGEFEADERTRVLHRALFSASVALLRIAQAYEPPPAGFWHDVYRIYVLALRLDLRDESVTDSEGGATADHTVENLFKRILLFDIMDPGRYRQRAMQQLYDIIAEFGRYSLLEPRAPFHDANAVYGFNLHSDHAPRHLSIMGRRSGGETLYLLTRPVAERINARFLGKEGSQTAKVNAPSSVTLMRLIKTLGAPAKRKYARVPENVERTMVIGYRNLLAALAASDPDAQKEKASIERERQTPDPRIAGGWEVPDLDLVPMENDFGSLFSQSGEGRDTRNKAAIAKALAGKGAQKHPKKVGIWSRARGQEDILSGKAAKYSGEVVDGSASGYCIVWKSGEPRIKIGDVVGLHLVRDEKLEIAIIRRIGRTEEGELLFGVELVAPEAKLVSVSIPGHEETRVRAVFLQGVPAVNQPDSVILPPSDFRPGEFVTLVKDGESFHCRLTNLLQSTAAFNHMSLAYTK